MSSKLAPVLFIIFNRPFTTQKVFEAIRTGKPSSLYIAADAPRQGNITDEESCKATRAITENIDWPCKVKRLYQEKNLGCSLGPRAAFDWFFSDEEEGIILEDDCVPHQDFFPFATCMLERFRDNKKIISINGSNFGYRLNNGDSYTFSRFMNMWGWATWTDRASQIDYTLSSWNQSRNPLWFLYTKMRQNLFDTDVNWYKYWQHKFDLTVTKETVTWWDWQWIWHQTLHQQLSIVPAVNLVTNIGFNEDATHTQETSNPAASIALNEMELPLVHPSIMKPDYVYEESYVKWVWCYHKRLPALFHIKQFVSNFLKK
ncbi:MAG: nucleotide-diphospho-sugar transferase [Bacteroidia bacterium]|nr:nucleotide-diphospho-sugar transferase [Bacteroidia bacterium]